MICFPGKWFHRRQSETCEKTIGKNCHFQTLIISLLTSKLLRIYRDISDPKSFVSLVFNTFNKVSQKKHFQFHLNKKQKLIFKLWEFHIISNISNIIIYCFTNNENVSQHAENKVIRCENLLKYMEKGIGEVDIYICKCHCLRRITKY